MPEIEEIKQLLICVGKCGNFHKDPKLIKVSTLGQGIEPPSRKSCSLATEVKVKKSICDTSLALPPRVSRIIVQNWALFPEFVAS